MPNLSGNLLRKEEQKSYYLSKKKKKTAACTEMLYSCSLNQIWYHLFNKYYIHLLRRTISKRMQVDCSLLLVFNVYKEWISSTYKCCKLRKYFFWIHLKCHIQFHWNFISKQIFTFQLCTPLSALVLLDSLIAALNLWSDLSDELLLLLHRIL